MMSTFPFDLRRLAGLSLAALLMAVLGTSSGHAADAQRIGHVFVIVLENKTYEASFVEDPNSYLAKELPALGALLPNYYGTSHNSLGNYISMISGQGANTETQLDCPTYSQLLSLGTDKKGQVMGLGCIYPASTPSLASQLSTAGISWKAYMQDMGYEPGRYDPALASSAARPYGPRRCGHAQVGRLDKTQSASATDQYAQRHNPFVYFHGVIDDQAYCDGHVVNLQDHLQNDLGALSTTAKFTFITPNLCDDGHDANCASGQVGGLIGINRFLKKWVPAILNSPAFLKDGLLIVTYDESDLTQTGPGQSCCGEKGSIYQVGAKPGITSGGGGQVGAVLISPFIKPGSVSQQAYNHYSLLRSVEDIFGLAYLGHAADGAPAGVCVNDQQPCSFGADVYTGRLPALPPRPAS